MSLVLEALRKQQVDSDPAAALSLALQDTRPSRQGLGRLGLGLTLLALALLCNAALVSWLFRDRLFGAEVPGPAAERARADTAPSPASSAPDAGSIAAGAWPSNPPSASAGIAPPAADAGRTIWQSPPGVTPNGAVRNPPGQIFHSPPEMPLSATGQLPQPGYTAGTQSPAPAGFGSPTLERISLDALPAAARDRFPGIAISTHVFAQDPALRAIIANGARLQEGDQIAGLRLREIDEDGVLIEFENYLVDVPVFTDW